MAEFFGDNYDFEAEMREIDRDLAENGVPIHARPINAMLEFSKKHSVKLPFGGYRGADAELRVGAHISREINKWFENRYGDRLKVDMSPGMLAVRVNGDLYELKVPLIYGTANFILSDDLASSGMRDHRGVPVCNVYSLVDGITPALIRSIHEDEHRRFFQEFIIGMQALYILMGSREGDDLVNAAVADARTAVSLLVGNHSNFGASKWASLQLSEKMLKSAISRIGLEFPKTHTLERLVSKIASAGFELDVGNLLQAIQCEAGIRYGEHPCSANEAADAHIASMKLVNVLYRSGLGFIAAIEFDPMT